MRIFCYWNSSLYCLTPKQDFTPGEWYASPHKHKFFIYAKYLQAEWMFCPGCHIILLSDGIWIYAHDIVGALKAAVSLPVEDKVEVVIAITFEAALRSTHTTSHAMVHVADGTATKVKGDSGVPTVLPTTYEGSVGNWACGARNKDKLRAIAITSL